MDDSLGARILPTCPADVSKILHHAWNHALAELKPLLSVPGRASVQEPTTGETPLHAAIRSCAFLGNRQKTEGEGEGEGDVDGVDNENEASKKDMEAKAKAVLVELFMSGAIWNDVDSNNETPGCLADRLGLRDLYRTCLEAGVRAELLFGLLDGYEELSSDDDTEEDEEKEETGEGVEGGDAAEPDDIIMESDPSRAFVPPKAPANVDVNSAEYLRSALTYDAGKLVDSAQNGVMMEWETSIMRASVEALLPGLPTGKRILNIGFGMGIIDGMFAERSPSKHHIIEAHPAVLEYINGPESKFGKQWEALGPAEGANKVYAGKWQEVSSCSDYPFLRPVSRLFAGPESLCFLVHPPPPPPPPPPTTPKIHCM